MTLYFRPSDVSTQPSRISSSRSASAMMKPFFGTISDRRSFNATRIGIASTLMWPVPAEAGVAWWRIVGLISVSVRGSSNRNGLVIGLMKWLKQSSDGQTQSQRLKNASSRRYVSQSGSQQVLQP